MEDNRKRPDIMCIETAERAGHEPEEAGNCENGSLKCPGCPFTHKKPGFFTRLFRRNQK